VYYVCVLLSFLDQCFFFLDPNIDEKIDEVFSVPQVKGRPV